MKGNACHSPSSKFSSNLDSSMNSSNRSRLRDLPIHRWVLLVFIIAILQLIVSTFSIGLLDSWPMNRKYVSEHIVISSNLDHGNYQVRLPKRRDQQVLILIASPGTPDFKKLEQNLHQWNKALKIGPWSWAIPDISPTIYNTNDGFGPFIESVSFLATSPPRGYDGFNRTAKTKSDYFLTQFSQSFLFEWMKNKHILICSDQFYMFHKGVDESVRTLLLSLPWWDDRYSLYGSNQDVKVAVLYPTNRFEHISNVFQSVAPPRVTFLEWLSRLEDLSSFDVLSLAQSFQDKGISVEVLPFSSTEFNTLNDLVICKVLGGIDCDNGKMPKPIDTDDVDDDEPDSKENAPGETRKPSLPDKEHFLKLLSDYECSFQFMTMCSSNVSTEQARKNFLSHIRSYQN